jgi:hypothetical protein
MAADLDEQVTAFRTRSLAESGPFTFVAADALTMKVRENGRVVNAVVLVATGSTPTATALMAAGAVAWSVPAVVAFAISSLSLGLLAVWVAVVAHRIDMRQTLSPQ